VKLTTHFHLVPRSRMVELTSTPLYVFVARCLTNEAQEQLYLFIWTLTGNVISLHLVHFPMHLCIRCSSYTLGILALREESAKLGKLIARVNIRFHAFLISSLDGSALSVSRVGRAFCGKRAHGIHRIGGCLWRREGLEIRVPTHTEN
jgi:hypothetical protein